MYSFKRIITSGCSFSDPRLEHTWPHFLTSTYDIPSNHLGLVSQGNGLIARKAIYAVQEALKSGIKPEDLLVGIMWSGPDRHDMYFSDLNEAIINTDGWVENPTRISEEDHGGWLIMNHHWIEGRNKAYYSQFHDIVHQRVLTLEKMLWTQEYLKGLGVPYFMTRFMDTDLLMPENVNTRWLESMIDYSYWLPIGSIHSWTYNYWTDEDYPLLDIEQRDGSMLSVRDFHPTFVMNEKFVEEVVLPFIRERYNNYYTPKFKTISYG